MAAQLDQSHGFLQAQMFDALTDFLFGDDGFGGLTVNLNVGDVRYGVKTWVADGAGEIAAENAWCRHFWVLSKSILAPRNLEDLPDGIPGSGPRSRCEFRAPEKCFSLWLDAVFCEYVATHTGFDGMESKLGRMRSLLPAVRGTCGMRESRATVAAIVEPAGDSCSEHPERNARRLSSDCSLDHTRADHGPPIDQRSSGGGDLP